MEREKKNGKNNIPWCVSVRIEEAIFMLLIIFNRVIPCQHRYHFNLAKTTRWLPKSLLAAKSIGERKGYAFDRRFGIPRVRSEFVALPLEQDSAKPISSTSHSTVQWIDRSQNNSFGCQISACFQYLLLKYSPPPPPPPSKQFIQSKGNCRTRVLLGQLPFCWHS